MPLHLELLPPYSNRARRVIADEAAQRACVKNTSAAIAARTQILSDQTFRAANMEKLR